MALPGDSHVHSEFSWDATDGSMVLSCERAVELGLPSVAFTEHVDLTPWSMHDADVNAMGPFAVHVGADRCFHAPEVDIDAYFESIDRCRSRFPELRIFTGLEIGEPHWFPDLAQALLNRGPFERRLGSLHSLTVDGRPRLVDEWFRSVEVTPTNAADAVRGYLAEAVRLIEGSDHFEVLGHIDYVTRQLAMREMPHDPTAFESEYRAVLAALAGSGRVLEINTRVPLDRRIHRWWHEVGGAAVSFGSDAHSGPAVGHGFAEAAAMAESVGFHRQDDPLAFWSRNGPAIP